MTHRYDPSDLNAPADTPPWNEAGIRDHPRFLAYIEEIEAHPRNQSGVDKSCVDPADRAELEHYRQVLETLGQPLRDLLDREDIE